MYQVEFVRYSPVHQDNFFTARRLRSLQTARGISSSAFPPEPMTNPACETLPR